MNTNQIIEVATAHLQTLPGHIFDVLTITKPVSPEAAVNLSKILSKLSAILGNLIEFNLVELLNDQPEFQALGKWKRQDPGFPDTIFESQIQPVPGFEIKAWFPLATEITARFKDSQNHFVNGNIHVALIAWLPEYLIYGKPRILGVSVIEGGSIAKARDDHYHNPPDYLVIEPEDTKVRTRNLQQTTTNGYKWQGSASEFTEAKNLVESWGKDGSTYQPTQEYQALLRQLQSRYKYRLDTNFAKIDRIAHPEIEAFKRTIYNTTFHGMTVQQWLKIYDKSYKANDELLRQNLAQHLNIVDVDSNRLVE
jgi:hypothetical protein